MGNSLQAVAAFWQLLQNMLKIASGKINFLFEDDYYGSYCRGYASELDLETNLCITICHQKKKKKKKKSSFQCKFCEVCLTNGGLKKHVTKKHSSSKVQESSSSDCLKRFIREKCLQIRSR